MGDDLYCDGRAVPPAMSYTLQPALAGAALLRAFGNPSPCCCWCIAQCTQNTDINEIMHSLQGASPCS
jgi:hypothetical protein